MEYSDFIELPEDRCGFSEREHTCVRAAWHVEPHRMMPRTWIRRTNTRLDVVMREHDYAEVREARAG